MNRGEGFNGFDLDDQTILNKVIKPTFTHMRSFVDHRYRCLWDICDIGACGIYAMFIASISTLKAA